MVLTPLLEYWLGRAKTKVVHPGERFCQYSILPFSVLGEKANDQPIRWEPHEGSSAIRFLAIRGPWGIGAPARFIALVHLKWKARRPRANKNTHLSVAIPVAPESSSCALRASPPNLPNS